MIWQLSSLNLILGLSDFIIFTISITLFSVISILFFAKSFIIIFL